MRLTKDLIEQLRKEFLLLMKNEKQAAAMDYNTLKRWNDAFFRWSTQRFAPIAEAVADQFVDWPTTKKRVMEGTYPLRRVSLPMFQKPDQYRSEEVIASNVRREIPRWAASLRRQAQAVWKVLEERTHSSEAQGDLPITVEDTMNLEGFQVTLRYQSSEDLEDLGKIREILRKYRSAAQDRLPLLLRRQLPLTFDFTCKVLPEFAAQYRKDHIAVCVSELLNKGTGVHIIAHEMGHHLYKTHLSEEDQKLWKMAISGNYGTIDLRDLLRMKLNSIEDLIDRDPILYLQVEGLREDPINHGLEEAYSLRRIEDYLSEGGNPLVKVKTKPITGYGAKNDEEAFCEAVGLLVGYGPKAVLPEVRQILRILFPRIRISRSLSRIVAAAGKSALLVRP